MSFFLILIVIGVWTLVLYCVAYLATYPLKRHKGTRALVILILMGAGFTLPIWDELKGKEEFEALCSAGGVYQIVPETEGKKFDLIYASTPNRKLTGYARPVEEKTITYTDAATGNVIATAKAYIASGGWLVRTIGFSVSSTDGPLMGRDQCFPSGDQRAKLRKITNKVLN